tara:strand:+ start:494 stop:862 length:369 start_codon:yes stop_codon:yes gene_type:complete
MAYTKGIPGGGGFGKGGKGSGGGGGYKSKVSNLKLSEKDQKKLAKMDSTQAKKYLLKKGNRADIRSALGQAAKIAIGGPALLGAGIYFGAKKLAGDKKENIDSPKGKKSLFEVKKDKNKKGK